jgi:hypothetical protein
MRGFGRAGSVCNGPAPPPFRAPTPVGSPHHDLRPGAPTRSTLHHWIITCARCGAAAPDLAEIPVSARSVVGTPEYRSLAATAPHYALPFLRWAALCRAEGRSDIAADTMLAAAWAADDAADDKRATAWRLEAASLWRLRPVSDAAQLKLVDVLRRAGEFAAAKEACAKLQACAQDENVLSVLAFQSARIAAKDKGRHMMSSALRPPASTPHVAHAAKPAPKGLFGRLFGGG